MNGLQNAFDNRASKIGAFLQAGGMSADVEKCLAYAILKLEMEGDLELFVSQEIDSFERTDEDSK